MTTPRDPLVVIEALVKAGSELFAAWKAEEYPGGFNFHKKMWAFRAALSASAPMPAPEHQPFPHVGDNDSWTAPAPERVGVEEVMKLVGMLKDSAVCFGAAEDDDTERVLAHEIKIAMRSIESAVRRLGGGE